MYVLGGFDDYTGQPLDSIEQYNAVTDRWTNVGQLLQETSGTACAAYKTSIYVFGGAGQNDVRLDCVQVCV